MTGVEIAMISAAASAVSGVAALGTGVMQAKQAKKTAKYNAAVLQQQSDVEKAEMQRQQKLFLASQRVRGAATGATLQSFGDVQESSLSQSLLDQALLDYDTRLQKQQIIYQGKVSASQSLAGGINGLVSGLSGAAGAMGSAGSGAGTASSAATSSTVTPTYAATNTTGGFY